MLLGVEGFQGDLHEGSGDSVASFDMCLTGRYCMGILGSRDLVTRAVGRVIVRQLDIESESPIPLN